MSVSPPKYPGNEEAPYARNSTVAGPQFDFSDKTIRRGFIRKVYCILMCQLTVTTAIVSLFAFHGPTYRFVKESSLKIFLVCLVVTLPVLIALACYRNLARKSPINLILLFIFTLGESVLCGLGTIRYNTLAILMALGLTALICFGLTIYAFQTKTDFTACGGILFVGLLILVLAGIVGIFYRAYLFNMMIAGAGVFLFSIYLIYDTQLMMGGEHQYAISPEEYIFAAINIYLDILNIFLYILQFFES